MNLKCNIENLIFKICRNEYKYFFNKPNVIGVGLGYKLIKGFYTCKKCIVVFVSNKLPNNMLTMQERIPSTYKGITTDVIESGIFKGGSLTNKIRPVVGGYSIGPESVYSGGSQGCLVTDGKDRYLLSCNHVIAEENSLPLGTHILQPSLNDGGKIGSDVVAVLKKFVPLKKTSPANTPDNYVDCAIAKEFEPNILSPKIAFLGEPHGIDSPKLHQSVQKVGRTSAHTVGYISALGTTIKVQLDRGLYMFKNQIITSAMGEKGDSGSILLSLNNLALGLFCAVGSSETIYNPIDMVFQNLGVTLVTD